MTTTKIAGLDNLALHFDIGHSSIGWAVTRDTVPVTFAGTGVVLFQADSCMASTRRMYRRQRRHIRSTRQRISRMASLIAHIDAMKAEELAKPGCAWPWKLAASVLSANVKLSWPELWDVLRWYAHNRGYDGNLLWKRGEADSETNKEDQETVENAHELLKEYGKNTMCETVCSILAIAPTGVKSASGISFKGKRASFPREIIEAEVFRLLSAHVGILPHLDPSLVRALTGNPVKDPDAWKAINCSSVKLPKRYLGGLLFGQLAPRFDNRIIGECPVSGEKLPSKNSTEFLYYRWAMVVANIRMFLSEGPRSLSPSERQQLTQKLREVGYFTKGEFKKALKAVTGIGSSNLDTMLMHPDAEEALVLYPGLKAVSTQRNAPFWAILNAAQKRSVLKALQRHKQVSLKTMRELLDSEQQSSFDKALQQMQDGLQTRAKKPHDNESVSDILNKPINAAFPSGRAPYGRDLLKTVVAEVMEGRDPRQEDGCLFRASRDNERIAEDGIDQRTNNHLVRHRLVIFRRLIQELLTEFAAADPVRVSALTIEVNRDVKEMSGKTAKAISQEMGLRLAQHRKVVKELKNLLGLEDDRLGGSFIRKARIADDLGWTCPYTGMQYDVQDIRSRKVDLDHIIPRSARASDSLDSLVITFKEVNAWKGARTALQFIRDEQGKPVPGLPNLSILSESQYANLVDKLSMHGSHMDDSRRRKNRKERLLTLRSDETGFTPGDLTVTSHLVTLASAVARDVFADNDMSPRIIALPGRVTKEIRTSWELMGLLAPVNPLVLNEDGTLKIKTEIRDITHLHHAVDACVLGLSASVIPANGRVWGLMIQRHHTSGEACELVGTGAFQRDAAGRVHLRALPEQTRDSIATCLAERRVAFHVPQRKHGVSLKLNTSGLVRIDGKTATIRQRKTDEKTGLSSVKTEPAQIGMFLGIAPEGLNSKLKAIKGVLEIEDNFGVALDPVPQVIPFHKVWHRIGAIKKMNGGSMPRIIRKGQIIEVKGGSHVGVWRVCSVKNNAAGIALDIALPDFLRPAKKIEGCCKNGINILLKSLLASGLIVHENTLVGVASCPTTSSTSAVRPAQSPAKTAN